ncbi:MAG: DUF3887 domain-containing protein [Sarcina sp.]
MKKLIKGLLICMPMLFLVACGGNTLSEKFDEAKVNESTKNVIEWLAKGEFEKVYEVEDEVMQSALNQEKLSQTFKPINEKVGEYKDVSKIVMKEKDSNVKVVAISNYEKGKLQFTITFNEEMKISGLYVK